VIIIDNNRGRSDEPIIDNNRGRSDEPVVYKKNKS
jgi:hypothetical protein